PTFYSLTFFYHYTATTEIYTLSLHDALPIYRNPLPRLLHPVEGPDVALFCQPVEAIPDSGDLDEVDLAFRHGLLLDHSTGCSFVLHGVPWFPRPATPILP